MIKRLSEMKNPDCFNTMEFNNKSTICKTCSCFKECRKMFNKREVKIKK